MKLIDPHQCGSKELCKVRLLDLQMATSVFISRMQAAGGWHEFVGPYYSPNSGGKIANVLDIDILSPLGNIVRERWYVLFKAELYWHFGKIYKHPDWGMGASVPLKMLADAKYGEDGRIAIMHDIDVCYGMRAAEWITWAEKHHTIDLEQKPDKSAGMALKFMRRVF